MSWKRFFRRKKWDEERARELAAHLQIEADENVSRGMLPDEARYAANRKLGNALQIREEIFHMNSIGFLETLWQDICYGLRLLRKNPGFTAVAVLTLALGIGANTAIFSLINSLLLRSLPIQNPQQVVILKWSAQRKPGFHSSSSYGDCMSRMVAVNPSSCSFSLPFYQDLQSHSAAAFSGVAASGGESQLDLSGNGPASIVDGMLVSGTYFDVLGVRPAYGRTLEPADDQPGAPAVAVLNYGYWKRFFGGDVTAIGRTVELNSVPTTIVGIAEPRFTSLTPGSIPDAWLPLTLRSKVRVNWNAKHDAADSVWLLIIARMKSGISVGQASATVDTLFRNELLRGAEPLAKESDAPNAVAVPAQTGLVGARGRFSQPLYILMLAVGVVLLIACANVAGLLLARSAARQKEVALRLALGAGRARIIRQLLTESVLLSVLGGALGILVAIWGAHAILALVAGTTTRPLGFDASLDWRVLSFTIGISLATGIFFGLAPALRGTRVDLTPSLKEGTGSSGGAGHGRSHWFNIGNSLVVGQVALTMIVLVGAGLLVRTLQNLRNIEPGFDTSNILIFSVNPTLIGYKGTKVDDLKHDLQERLAAIPGVKSVSYSSTVLLSGSLSNTSYHMPNTPDKQSVDSDMLEVGPRFFATMKMDFAEGRDFTPAEFAAVSIANAARRAALAANPNTTLPPGAPTPVVVNKEFVRQYLAKLDPVGQQFGYPGDAKNEPTFVIVGVVSDARYNDLRRAVQPTTYVPATGGGVSFEVRTAMNPTAIVPQVRSIVNQLDSNLPVFRVMTESDSIDQLLFEERFIARLSSFFGILALILACVGLYGLLSYEVSRRTREIGIRMALGAGQANVLKIVVGQGIVLAFLGVVVGTGAAIGVTRYLSSILYDVHTSDPTTLLAVGVIMLVVALAACSIPARRATRVDPMVALRNE